MKRDQRAGPEEWFGVSMILFAAPFSFLRGKGTTGTPLYRRNRILRPQPETTARIYHGADCFQSRLVNAGYRMGARQLAERAVEARHATGDLTQVVH